MKAKVTIDNNVKQKLLDSLAEESPIVISTAYAYAKNYVNYGEDITKAWTTAVQQASIIEQIKVKAQVEAYDYFKKDYENRLKADLVSILEELQLEINGAEMHRYDDQIDKAYNVGLHRGGKIIQLKINALKENKGNE